MNLFVRWLRPFIEVKKRGDGKYSFKTSCFKTYHLFQADFIMQRVYTDLALLLTLFFKLIVTRQDGWNIFDLVVVVISIIRYINTVWCPASNHRLLATVGTCYQHQIFIMTGVICAGQQSSRLRRSRPKPTSAAAGIPCDETFWQVRTMFAMI